MVFDVEKAWVLRLKRFRHLMLEYFFLRVKD